MPGEFSGTVEGFMSFLHGDDRERVWANIQRALENLEPFAFEERIIRADGIERVLLSQGRPLLTAVPRRWSGSARTSLSGSRHNASSD